MSTPTKAADGAIELDLRHSAPLFLRPRRGEGYEIARTPLVTPVRIPRLPRGGMEEMAVAVADERETLHVHGGRTWRRACPGVPLAHVLKALASDDPDSPLRGEVDDLWLDPAKIMPESGTFMGFHPAETSPAPDRVLVDLADRVASGTAARFARGVMHDGSGLWIEVDPPMLNPWGGALGERERMEQARDNVWGDRRRKFMPDRPVGFRVGHGALEDLLRYRAHALQAGRGKLPRRSVRDEGDTVVSANAGQLRRRIEGLGDPDADVARYVRTIGAGILPVVDTILGYRTRERPRLDGEPAQAIRADVAAFLPHAGLAMVNLVPKEDFGVTVDRADALLAKLEPHLPRTGSYAITYVREHRAFIRNVVRPRLWGAIPEADAESLSAIGGP